MGSFSVSPLVFRLVCRNGMIRQDFARRKYHTGARLGGDAEMYEYYRDDTVRARNEATVLEMRDLISGALSDAVFGKIVDNSANLPSSASPAIRSGPSNRCRAASA